ncbi:hypothetical protein ACFLXY_07355 [Chloroflexota bacterium]
MENKQKTAKSAHDISVMADYISKAVLMDYPAKDLKVVLGVPLKQLQDEVEALRVFINVLK